MLIIVYIQFEYTCILKKNHKRVNVMNASDLIGIFPSQFNNVYTIRWIKIRTIRTYSHIDRCIKFWRESLRTDGRSNRQTDRQTDVRTDG